MKPLFERAALALVLAIALALRLWHVDFGLPALNDPDEPLFVMTAVDMLRDGQLNPGWFGHPATTLFYALALVFLLVGVAGMAFGRWDSVDGFVSAVYANPAIAFLPMRLFIVVCGVACVYLTYRIGRRALGPRAGLFGATLLAVNALHVEYSQIIRTDMLASVFMLSSTLFAMRIATRGKLRDYLLAGSLAGLACATKWPAALVVLNAIVAAGFRWRRGDTSPVLILVPVVAAGAALVLASPFLLFDYPTVLRDLGGEARPIHLGATGGSPVANLWWYITNAFGQSFGPAATVLAIGGVVLSRFVARPLVLAVLPGALAFLAAISAQSLIWERWTVPLLPYVALAITVAATVALQRMRGKVAPFAAAALSLVLLVPPLSATFARTTARADDTRLAAAAWVKANVPDTASILLEHAGFDLLDRPGAVFFPLGRAGCVDVRRMLSTRPRHRNVNALRTDRAIVDIGHLDREALPGCSADVAILSHYSRYLVEADRFPKQVANYHALLKHGRVITTFAPVPNVRGGPVVHIVQLRAGDAPPP